MKKIWMVAAMSCLVMAGAFAQKQSTRTGKVHFDATSASSPEKIEATNNSATSVVDPATGKVAISVLVKGFLFEKALMQEHFNENYLESDKFPKATFEGTLVNAAAVNFTKDGTYKANVKGTMTMHGVTKSIEVPVTFTVKKGKISATSTFDLKLADYGVAIPAAVKDKVATNAKMVVTCDYAPM